MFQFKTHTYSKEDDKLINNFGSHVNLKVSKDRHNTTRADHLKYILFWNEAYGSKEYDIGFGRDGFVNSVCPETRCYTTANRQEKEIAQRWP